VGRGIVPVVESWPYTERSRIDDTLDRLAVLRAQIQVLMNNRPTIPCGSAGNPHMWTRLQRTDGTWYRVCAKCGAGG
jgi:hypothetical protein